MVVNCKDFNLVIDGNKLYIKTRLQTFRLQGHQFYMDLIIDEVNKDTSLSQLVQLFYAKDDRGNSTRQMVTMESVSIKI